MDNTTEMGFLKVFITYCFNWKGFSNRGIFVCLLVCFFLFFFFVFLCFLFFNSYSLFIIWQRKCFKVVKMSNKGSDEDYLTTMTWWDENKSIKSLNLILKIKFWFANHWFRSHQGQLFSCFNIGLLKPTLPYRDVLELDWKKQSPRTTIKVR